MRITVLREPQLPKRHISVSANQLFQYIDGVVLIIQTAADILGNGVCGDIFFNEHGEVYPIAIEERLYEFFQTGGGLLHIGGAPFETAMKFEDGRYIEIIRTFGDSRDEHSRNSGPTDAPMDYFRARLGFTAYQPPFEAQNYDDCELIFDRKLVDINPINGAIAHDMCANLASTVQMRMFKPELEYTDHRAYQARPIVRETVYAGNLTAPDGSELMRSLQYIKAWGNPYTKAQDCPLRPWVLFYARVHKPLPKALMQSMCNWLVSPVFIKNIDLPRATLHEGETTHITAKLTAPLPDGWLIEAQTAAITKQQFIAHSDYHYIPTPCEVNGSDAVSEISYQDGALLSAVRFDLYDEYGILRDTLSSGIAMWNPDTLRDTTKVTPNGCYFDMQSERGNMDAGWVPGTNWQDRHLFGFTWYNPNPLRLASDALDMANTGMVFVRPHFFMPGWFRAVPGTVFADGFSNFYNSFDKGPLLNERHMRALEAHVMLFCSMGLVFMPSVYTAVGANMGNPMHWMGTSKLFIVREFIENQKVFANQIMERFADVPSISWDLMNEPDTGIDIACKWLTEHKAIWGKSGQMVSVGVLNRNDSLLLGESADWHSIHGKSLPVYRSGKPFMLHEAHYPVPPTFEGGIELEEHLNRAFAMAIRDGGCGVIPWNWNLSYFNWRYHGGIVDWWDLHLGLCAHADGTPHSGRIFMRNWHTLLSGLSFDQSAHRKTVFVYPKTTTPGAGSWEYFDLMKSMKLPFLGVNDKDFASFDLSKTKLVIFPDYGLGFREMSYERMRQFASDGGVVWAHTDNMVLDEDGNFRKGRDVPEMGIRQDIGNGFIQWCLGWNLDNLFGAPLGSEVNALGKVINESLELTPYSPDAIPLKDGQIRIIQHHTKGLRGMKYDWVSEQPWPDGDDVTGIDVLNNSGNIVKAWRNGTDAVSVDGLTFTPRGYMFFIRERKGMYYINAGEVTICGDIGNTALSLARNDNYCKTWETAAGMPDIQQTHTGMRLMTDGWRKMCWIKMEIE